jgi:Protein of unknown function (DUF3800)
VVPSGSLPVRLFYVDDSGAVETGWIVYSWIECAVADWRHGLRWWLDLRKKLFSEHRIPPAYELHAAHFIGGRGDPSTDAAWNRHKSNRALVVRQALAAIGTAPHLRVGTSYRRTLARGSAYHWERLAVYDALVAHVDTRCAAHSEYGMIFMDGDGSEQGYYSAHRALKLANRHVIEDPLFQVSHRSQWVQMADLVAWTAYQSLQRSPARQFAWDWYDHYLFARDAHGGAISL